MKQITALIVLLGLMVITASACNNDNGKTDGSETVSSEAPKGGSGDDWKPVFLTKETFKEKVWDYEKHPDKWVYEGNEPAIIDFYADWCKPCKMVAPILEEIAKEYDGKLKVYKINTQNERELAAVFQIRSIPTFLFIPTDGKPQMDKGYKDKATFEQIIKQFLIKQ